jgi:thymidylate kinase
MNKGKFIVVYGMNNLGKTTMVNGLIDFLKTKGKEVIYLKYPIYDLEPTGPRINRYLREGNPEKLTPATVQKYFSDNRRDFEPKLIKMIDEGKWVVAEDYKGTGIAWGMIGGYSVEKMEEINKNLYDADLSILLDGERFLTGIEKDHTHESATELWSKGRQIHLDLAKRYGWKIAKANQTREEVLNEVINILKKESFL